MKKIKLETNNKNSVDFFEKLYKNAFPKSERIENEILYDLLDNDKIDISIYEDEGLYIGLSIMFFEENSNLLAYFAIDKSHRSKGYGSDILAILKEEYQNIIVEIESTNIISNDREIRTKRKSFYDRNGFYLLDHSIFYFGIEMQLMSTNKFTGIDDYFNNYYKVFKKSYINENIILKEA